MDEDECEFVIGNCDHDKIEGILPGECDEEFATAVAEFAVTAKAQPLEDFDDMIIDLVTYGFALGSDGGNLRIVVERIYPEVFQLS